MENYVEMHHAPTKIEDKNLLCEIEKIKLAELLNLQGKISQQVDLLEVLVYQQKNNPSLKWKYQRRSLLDLARAYVQFEQIEDAIDNLVIPQKSLSRTP